MNFFNQVVFVVSIMLLISCKTEKEEVLKQQDVTISYELRERTDRCSNQLVANIDGNKEVIIDYDEHLFLFVQLQDDFNNDGALDILLEHRKGCHTDERGVTSVSNKGSSYFIVTYDGKKFRKTEEVGLDWNGIEMELKEGKFHFTIESDKRLPNYKEKENVCDYKEEVFTLEGYQLKSLVLKENSGLEAVKEINFSLDNYSKYTYETIDFDLDGDKQEDYLEISYRRGFHGFNDFLARGIHADMSRTELNYAKRIGILSTKTNGVHDIVVDCNTVFNWNGKRYTKQEKKQKNELKKGPNYKVFAKSGLIIRDKPASYGNVIGKFDYGAEITILEKTAIEMKYQDKEEEYPIEGYWYKTEFLDKERNTKIKGYVFSGFLIDLDYYSIFSRWDLMSISRNEIVVHLHGQCAYTYPVKIISDTEVELIWSQDGDCVFDSGLSDSFGMKNVPVVGKPFAKLTWKGNTLKATYYYPEWTKKYNDKYPAIFLDTYDLNYSYLTDW